MKRVLAGCIGGAILLSGVCLAAEKMEVTDETGRINYSIGYQMGGDFQRQGWKLNPELLVRGIKDAIDHADPQISPEQMNTTLVSLKKRLVATEQAASQEADSAFLTKIATEEGVVTLPSGVKYRVIKEGTGRKPTLNDSVTIRYQVERSDGQMISTGYPDSKPKTYPLKKAIPGLQEVLQLMKEGSIWQVVLTRGAAMGGQAETLQMAGVLIYQLELVSVQPGK